MASGKGELVQLQEALYDSKNPTRAWLHNRRRDWVTQALTDSARGRDVDLAIEVGPGSGIYMSLLAALSRQVIASDIEPQYLEHTRGVVASFPNVECRVDDITASELPQGQCDLVLCTEVIEHIADSPGALDGLRRLLSDDGRLVLSTPQRYSPLEVCSKVAFLPGIISVVRMIYREPIIPTGHINLLTETALKRQLDDAGFVIVQQYKCGVYVPVVAEALGEFGLKIGKWLEAKIRGTRLDFLLWTQCYVLKAK